VRYLALVLVLACEPPPSRPGRSGSGVPQAGHVFIVTEENHDYADVIDSSAMP